MGSSQGRNRGVYKGDVNGDGLVNLQDVILPLQVVACRDSGTTAPGTDMDGDGKVSLKEALILLRIISDMDNYLPFAIDAYEEYSVVEESVSGTAFQELEILSYMETGAGPALKVPTFDFIVDGYDFSVDMGFFTPLDGEPETIATVQALFYSNTYSEWVYGVNQTAQTSLLAASSHNNDFSSTYSLFVDGLQMISGSTL